MVIYFIPMCYASQNYSHQNSQKMYGVSTWTDSRVFNYLHSPIKKIRNTIFQKFHIVIAVLLKTFLVFDWTVWWILNIVVCVQCTLLFDSMHLSRPIVFITLLQYFEHHIIVTHATIFSSCAIFENHLMGMKTYKRKTLYAIHITQHKTTTNNKHAIKQYHHHHQCH